jgi:hypothetical protein
MSEDIKIKEGSVFIESLNSICDVLDATDDNHEIESALKQLIDMCKIHDIIDITEKLIITKKGLRNIVNLLNSKRGSEAEYALEVIKYLSFTQHNCKVLLCYFIINNLINFLIYGRGNEITHSLVIIENISCCNDVFWLHESLLSAHIKEPLLNIYYTSTNCSDREGARLCLTNIGILPTKASSYVYEKSNKTSINLYF